MNWQPQFKGIDGFKQGLEKTIEWFTKDENLATIKPNKYNL